MSGQHASPVTFQLRESIWLEQQTRSADILTLELVPDVEVLEEGERISIVGDLILSGRFQTEDDDEVVDFESSSLAEQLQFQPLEIEQKEIYLKDQRGRIEKRFPVNISLPANKVPNVADVLIHVQEFDYAVADGQRLHVEAEIAISGIDDSQENTDLSSSELERSDLSFTVQASAEQSENASVEEEHAEGEEQSDVQVEPFNEPETSFEVPSVSEADKEDDSSEQADTTEGAEVEPFAAVRNLEEDESTKSIRSVEDEEGEPNSRAIAENKDNTEQISNHVQRAQEESALDDNDKQKEEEEASAISHSSTETDDRDQDEETNARPKVRTKFHSFQEDTDSTPQMDAQTSESIIDEIIEPNETESIAGGKTTEGQNNTEQTDSDQGEESERDEQTLSFLSQLMAESDTEEQATTRLTMVIVQDEQSIDEIADRYDISKNAIIQRNALESETIEKGQLLYIPRLD